MSVVLEHRSAETSVSIATLFASGAVQVTAAIMLNVLPAIVGSLTDMGRLDAAQAGYVVGADLAAQVAGTLLYMSQGWRIRWSSSVSLGIVFMAVGNLLSCVSTTAAVLIVTRLVAGGGVGVLRSACLALFGRARDPARAMGLLSAGQVISMSGAFAVFPWLTRKVGWFGPYLLLSILGLMLFATAPWWPKRLNSDDVPPISLSFGTAGGLCLVATFLYYVAQGGAWAFLEAIGAAAGVPATSIGAALAFVGIPGIAACLLASAISARVSIRMALISGGCLTLVSLSCLTMGDSPWTFACGVGLFYFAWCVTVPFLFAIAAECDHSGNAAAAFSAADGLGLAVGPAIAGTLVVRHGTFAVVVLAGLITAVSVMLFASSNALARKRLAVAVVGA